VFQEFKVKLDYKDHKDQQELWEKKVMMSLDLKEIQDHEDQQDHLDQWEKEDQTEKWDQLDQLDQKEKQNMEP
jgi:hypothetical protein